MPYINTSEGILDILINKQAETLTNKTNIDTTKYYSKKKKKTIMNIK